MVGLVDPWPDHQSQFFPLPYTVTWSNRALRTSIIICLQTVFFAALTYGQVIRWFVVTSSKLPKSREYHFNLWHHIKKHTNRNKKSCLICNTTSWNITWAKWASPRWAWSSKYRSTYEVCSTCTCRRCGQVTLITGRRRSQDRCQTPARCSFNRVKIYAICGRILHKMFSLLVFEQP